jgi:hypothetical protein
MARRPKYTRDDEKPVSVSLRLPRDLYDQAQHHADRRRTTLTALMVEGLRLSLETPLDSRDIVVLHDNTVRQELEKIIDARIQAALAAQRILTLDSTPAHPFPKSMHDKNITVIHDQSPSHDPMKYYLGKLCPKQHNYQGTGQSLLYRRNKRCLQCDKESTRERRKARAKAKEQTSSRL